MAQIALTTVFTPPASCFDNSYTLYGSPVYVKDVQVQSLKCYPEGFRALWSVGEPFSPGVCPESYDEASSSEGEKDETRVLCCPGSMTAHNGELGCFTEVHSETVLALPTGVVTVKGAMLAVHGVLVAWASSDLAVLPAVPGSAATTGPTETTSNGQREASTTPSVYASLTLSVTSMHTSAGMSPVTTTNSTTEKAESQISGPAGGTTSATQNTPTAEPPLSLEPPESITSTPPSASTSTTSQITQHLPPATMVGISIGAVASIAILAGLIASAILFRRRRRRAKAHNTVVDFRVFDSASEFHEDKRRWSELSSSFGTVSGRESGSGQTEIGEVSEADSRTLMLGVAELEGD